MECLECPRANDCHDQAKNDLQILAFIRGHVEGFRITEALESIKIFHDRLQRRNSEITGR